MCGHRPYSGVAPRQRDEFAVTRWPSLFRSAKPRSGSVHVLRTVDSGIRTPDAGDIRTTPIAFLQRRGGASMARVVVLNERQDQIALDEHVQPVNFDDEGTLLQMLERL